MAKRIKRKQIKRYIFAGGRECPYCGSENISHVHDMGDGDFHNTEGIAPTRNMYCLDCKMGWTEIYELVSLIPWMP